MKKPYYIRNLSKLIGLKTNEPRLLGIDAEYLPLHH